MRSYKRSVVVLVALIFALCAGVLSAAAYKGEIKRVTQGNADAGDISAISSDAKYVAFESVASDVVPGDTNLQSDVFRKDLASGSTIRVSTTTGSLQVMGSSTAPAMNASGSVVAFQSNAADLVAGVTAGLNVFSKNLTSGETTLVSSSSSGVPGNGYSQAPSISGEGRYVAFYSDASNLVVNDSNGMTDIFLKDLSTGQTRLVSTNSGGAQGNNVSRAPSISANGRFVVFESAATNLVANDLKGMGDIFRKDLVSGETTRVSCAADRVEAKGSSFAPSVSADGRFVAFRSDASNLVSDDLNGASDIFVKDMNTGVVTRVSRGTSGIEADGDSFAPSISADGQYVAFHSAATNLVSGDTLGNLDVFLWGRAEQRVTRVSCSAQGEQANGYSGPAAISSNGLYVAFNSAASNLVAGDSGGHLDIFLSEVGFPVATLGAPTKPSAVYSWAPFRSTGIVTPHPGTVATVSIEAYRVKTGAPLYRYTASTVAGGGTYASSLVRLPLSGYWYLRAKHQDASHRTSYSGWTTVYVSSAPVISAPKLPTTTMTSGKTYSVYGTIKPRHTSAAYITVRAYKLVGSTYVYKTSFPVRVTSSGQPAYTTKYIASIKLKSRGYWKLRVRHGAHGSEPSMLSGYSTRFRVK